MPRWSHWLIFLPVALLALFIPATKVEADALGNWVASGVLISVPALALRRSKV